MMEPEPPTPGSICNTCGHFATHHDMSGCHGAYPAIGCRFGDKEGNPCKVLRWVDHDWPRPWLPAPKGLIVGKADE